MKSINYIWQNIAGFNGFFALVMGTLAAHVITDSYLAAMAQRASFYQLIHAVLLFMLADRQEKRSLVARWLLISGMIFFCGSLYLRSLTAWTAVTYVAPLGGLSFMGAWLCLACGGLRKPH